MDRRKFTTGVIGAIGGAMGGAAAAPFLPGIARAADNPIRIGFGMAQTGPLPTSCAPAPSIP
jgi:hypothetical protein